MKVKGILSGLMLVGILLLLAPFGLCALTHNEVGIITFIWTVPGFLLVIVSVIGLIFSSLYVRAKSNLAFVRTGRGGRKVILDHGSIVIGFLHEIIPVSLETMKIVVERSSKDSLITLDKLRAEIVAEFYIRVKADSEGIATAARTLGDKISAAISGRRADQMNSESLRQAQERAIKELEREKLIDGLRTVAAKSSLEDLNLNRDEFKTSVIAVVKSGLEDNGLELEDCTISALDQAPKEIMDPNNSFDAQGLKNLQQVISIQSVARNEFERNAELAIKEKNVQTEKAVLDQDQELQCRTADQDREVRSYKAEQDKQAREAELANEESIGRRAIEKDKMIEVDAVQSEEAIALKEKSKEQAVETAQVMKEKTVEVAERDKEITIAKKETERADAEEKRQIAEALAEKALQDVKTVTVVETAERNKVEQVIAKEAVVKQKRIEEEMQADVKAYATAKEAEGRKQGAQADYEAKTKGAEADFVQKTKAAEGKRAEEMVPVEVAARQVEVDQSRVETVLRPELEAKSEHAKVSIDLTLGQAQIEADKDIGIAMANALGQMLTNSNMTIFGDPDTLSKMTEKFQKGQGWSNVLEGFLKGGAAKDIKSILPVLVPLAKKAGIDLEGLASKDQNTKKGGEE